MSKTRDKILDAANALFYADGVRAVSVDAVAERAGITKKTLYYHFRSKDDLIAAYLASRDQPNLASFKRWFDRCEGTLEDKVAAIFDGLIRAARRPSWRGCGFLRTIAELANMPGHPAVAIGAAHKKKFEAWLAEQLATESEISGTAEDLARQIVVVMDGAFSAMLTHRDPSYIAAAGATARLLVRGARSGRLD
ncbi:TetR/AcrR family transcriptional regulator [Salipiger mucosus]|uniref:Transcriptional regulator, TetR family n=1 Tax=Salipiger mucosus DSM 16094 TaxID=1123237 RepID=S9RQU6_9RHOB|nr:TetR/AcrR family transcriptional regulator [Salipiger mucosus]EPX76384.1 Transcriptional regulator, TetR family [Salipiger mucosus DSM 16094]